MIQLALPSLREDRPMFVDLCTQIARFAPYRATYVSPLRDALGLAKAMEHGAPMRLGLANSPNLLTSRAPLTQVAQKRDSVLAEKPGALASVRAN